MCGIAGYWSPAPLPGGPEPVLEAMALAMGHRGPDASGGFADPQGGPALAHVRLSILDLSPAGAQPMHSADGTLTISYNGEVYNYEAVRRELEDLGQAPASGWRGHSDTEVILEAVRAFGLHGALSRFVGMFAFALWDRRDRSLTLVRDRLGIKPLYYGFAGPSLLFGSEFKPLRRHPHWTGGVDPGALGLFLQTLYVPEPWSIHPGFLKLEPGHSVRLTVADLAARALPAPRAFWSLDEAVRQGRQAPFTGTDAQAVEALEALLTDAVRLRTVADVPLGAFLSGGVDSSTVTALLQKISTRPVKTFTIGDAETGYDEAAHAEAVAAHLGTEHTTLRVSPAQAREVIPLLPRFYDEPFADASQIPTCLVSRLAREQVVVALSGDGGDELFGGYNRYLLAPTLWARAARLPRSLRRALGALLEGPGGAAVSTTIEVLQRLRPPARRQLIVRDKLHKLAAALGAPSREAFFHALASCWARPEAVALGATLPPTAFTDPIRWPGQPDYAAWMMAMDMRTYLPGDVLHKVDRASMAVALEARVPLIDHRVAEFALSLPLAMKLRQGRGKWLLRQVLYRHVPQKLFDRPKQGFGVPIDQWLRGPLRDWARGLLDPARLKREGFLAPTPVARALDEHLSGRANRQYQLWAVLMFQAWLEEYGS